MNGAPLVPGTQPAVITKRRELTEREKRNAFLQLTALSQNGVLPHGAFVKIAARFSVAHTTMSRLWRDSTADIEAGVSPFKSKNAERGKSRIYNPEEVQAAVASIDPSLRSTMVSIGNELHMSASTVCRMKQAGILEAEDTAIKPKLTDNNKHTRLAFCFDHVDRDRMLYHNIPASSYEEGSTGACRAAGSSQCPSR